MRAALATDKADLIILDLMLPGEDGLSLCRELRAKGQTRSYFAPLGVARFEDCLRGQTRASLETRPALLTDGRRGGSWRGSRAANPRSQADFYGVVGRRPTVLSDDWLGNRRISLQAGSNARCGR